MRLARAGSRGSTQKITLHVLTGIASIYAWGFNPFGHGFFAMNFFRAWQYFAIVWSTDKKNVQRVFGVSAVPAGAGSASRCSFPCRFRSGSGGRPTRTTTRS